MDRQARTDALIEPDGVPKVDHFAALLWLQYALRLFLRDAKRVHQLLAARLRRRRAEMG